VVLYCHFRGGVDSVVLNDLIQQNNIKIDEIFVNKAVENTYNIRIINKTVDLYKTVHYPKTRSYKEIVWEYGHPIKNKNFSEMCYRCHRPISEKNINDRFRLIAGINYKDVQNSKNVQMLFTLPLRFWYLAKKYPIQTKCCDILKKNPAKKINRPMIIGIMKTDSINRRRAIRENKKGNFFPLQDWTKQDVFDYVQKFNIEISKSYQNRVLKDGTIVCGATNTGCMGCHYGNTTNHFYIDSNGTKHKTTKFENLERENPRMYKNIMHYTHKSGITFKETLQAYYDSENGKYLKESMELRNKDLDFIFEFLHSNKEIEAIKYLENFLANEKQNS